MRLGQASDPYFDVLRPTKVEINRNGLIETVTLKANLYQVSVRQLSDGSIGAERAVDTNGNEIYIGTLYEDERGFELFCRAGQVIWPEKKLKEVDSAS